MQKQANLYKSHHLKQVTEDVSFDKRLEEILKKVYSGSNHIGEVYNDEAISQIKSLIGVEIGEDEEKTYIGAYNMDKNRPENMDIDVRNDFRSDLRQKFNL